jgi:hypothetical protein
MNRTFLQAVSAGLLFSSGLFAQGLDQRVSLETVNAIHVLAASLAGGLAILSLLALGAVIFCLAKGEQPGVRSHWGGFGNGGRGWNMNASLTYLIIFVAFSTLLAAVGAYGMNSLASIAIASRVEDTKKPPPTCAPAKTCTAPAPAVSNASQDTPANQAKPTKGPGQ